MSRYAVKDLEMMIERQRNIRSLCDQLHCILRNKLTTSDNYRAGGTFKVMAMKQFGWTCNTRGLNSFKQPHGFIPYMGAHEFDYAKMPQWKQQVYNLAIELFTIIDRDYHGDRQFVVTISIMCPGSEVDRHRDMRDIGPQMLLSLGDFTGGLVRCFDEGNAAVCRRLHQIQSNYLRRTFGSRCTPSHRRGTDRCLCVPNERQFTTRATQST